MPEEALAGGAPAELGGMDEEAAVQELAMALEELGIDPAELAAAAAMEGGGGADPAALAGGGAPAEMGPPPELAGAKLAAAVEAHKRSGKFEFTEAKQGSAQRKVRSYMKGYVRELVGRN